MISDTVDGLWTWAELGNPDRDGDGLSNDEEADWGTDPDNWDSDGDGLSDGMEVDQAESLGTDPNDPDNDPDTDGICSWIDNCPADLNPDQADADFDFVGDATVDDAALPDPLTRQRSGEKKPHSHCHPEGCLIRKTSFLWLG